MNPCHGRLSPARTVMALAKRRLQRRAASRRSICHVSVMVSLGVLLFCCSVGGASSDGEGGGGSGYASGGGYHGSFGEECADGCRAEWVGDGSCDAACNVAACDYDDGDCTLGTDDAEACDAELLGRCAVFVRDCRLACRLE